MPGPWEKYAQKSPQDGPWAKYATTESAQPPASPPEPQPTMGQQAMSMAKDFGTGILKGAGSTANNIGHLLYPDFIAKHLTGAPSAEQQEGYFAPKSTSQAVGKGLEQVGEFFVPGGAEKMAGEKLATMVPKLAKFAAPIARMAGTEAVNEAQGGTPGVGAAGGAAGELVGAGLHALAPYAAETAMRIPMAARAFGKTPGRAILEDTRGVRPETVGRTAKETINRLTPAIEDAAHRASFRPNPAKAMLPAPSQEIPLAEPFIRDVKGELISAAPFPRGNIIGGSSPRVASELGSMESTIPPRMTRDDLFMTSGTHEPQPLPTSGPGVLLRRPAASGGPMPTVLPNEISSLAPARAGIGTAMSKAAQENTASVHGQLQPMQDFLSRRFATGETIPEKVTPTDLLNLKRGFSKEFLGKWSPDIHQEVTNVGRGAYHALDAEFDKAVPMAAEANQRISSLIPVLRAADKAERAPSLFQRTAGRLGAHTGALTLGAAGAAGGYKEGGAPGAIVGGVTGLVGPELAFSPESQMMTARLLNSVRALKPVTSAALQADRSKRKDKEGQSQ